MAVLNLARVIKDPEIVSTGNKQHKYRIIVSIPDVKNPTDVWKIVGFETSSPDFKNSNNETWVAIAVDPTRSVKVGETVDKFPIYRVDGKATQIISLDKQPELVRQILESERGSQLRIALENRDRQDQAQLLNPNNPIPPIGIDPVKNQEGNPLVHVNDLLSKTDSLHRQITDDFKYRKAGALPTEEPLLGIVPIPYPDSLYDPFTPGYIRIGHVPFTLSPEMIQIDREASMVSVPALRSKGSGKRGRGHYITRVDFQLRFCSEQEIVDTLLPLLRMIRKTPFLPVYNYYLNDLNDIQAISISNISLQTVQGLPNVIECSITSYAFNWHHYLHNDISFEDTICYPLLKMWCESSKSDVSEFNVSGGFPNWPVKVDRSNKPLRDPSKKLIPEVMNGKITFFLPNEESLKKYESTLKEEEIQTAETRGRIIDGNTAQSLTQVIDRSKDDSQVDQLFGYYNPKDSQNNSIEGTALVRKNQSIGYLPQLSYHNGGRDNDGPVLVVKTERPEQVIKILSLDKNVVAVGGDANITQTYYGSLDNNKNKTYIRSLKNPLPNPQGYFSGTEMDGGKTQDGLYMEMVALEDQKAGRPVPKAPTANPGDYVFIIPIPSITALKGTKNKKGEHAVRVFLDQMIAGSTLHKNPYHQRTFADIQPKSAAEGMKATAYTTEPSYTHLTFDEFPVDIVVESIQGGYANILTDHQVQLDEIPAHQYLGSTDIMLQVSCTVFSDSALSNIKDLFSKVEQLARRYNGSIYSTTPFGGFMKIDNEIFGLLGVKHVIPQRIRSATIPGFPNTHRVEMEFIEYDPTQRNREKLNRLEDPSWFSNSGFDQQSHRSGFGEATIKSNLLQEKLRTLELYPDMELPLISEVNEWIKIIQEGKDSVLERFPWMAGWEWTDSKDSGAIASLVPADFKRSQFKEDLENVSTTISNYLFGHGSLGSSGSISSFISESIGKFPLHDRFVDPDFYCIPSINTKDEIEKTLEDLAGQTTKLTSTFIGDSGDFRFPAYNSDGTLKENTGHITPDTSNALTNQYINDFKDMKHHLWMYEGDDGSGDNNTTNNTPNNLSTSGETPKIHKAQPLPEIPAVPDNPGGPISPINPGAIPRATPESKNQEVKSTGASPSLNQAAAVLGSLVQETSRRVANGVKNKTGTPPSDAWTQNLKLELARWYSAVIDLETGGSWLHVNPNGKVKGTNKTIEEWKSSSDRSSFGLGVGIAQVVPSVWYNTMPGGGDQIYTSWSANLRKGYEIWSNPTKGPKGRNPGPIEKQIVNNYDDKNPDQYDLGNILSFSTQSYIGWGKADKNGVNHNTYLNYVVSLMGSDDAADKLNASQQAETKKRRPELFQKLQVILGVSEQDINLANLDASNVTNPNLYNVSTGKFSELRRHPPQAAEQIPNMLHDMKTYSPRGRLLLAFPTHCVLLVDGGNWIRWRKLYDHFYGMSAVSEINIHTPAYRESPVQVAKITFNNLHGSLSTQQAEIERLKSADTRNNWGWSDIFGGVELALDPTNDWMIQQRWRHHIDSLMMKPGVRIHVRLGYGCVNDATEILTKEGWKLYNQVSIGDEVLTLNHEKGYSEWKPIQKMNIYNVEDEDMVEIDGHFHSSITTKNHKWPVQKFVPLNYGNEKKWENGWTTSDKLKTNHKIILSALNNNIPKTKKYSDELVETIAWFYTEGTLTGKNKKNIVLSQSRIINPENCERIRTALNKLFGVSKSLGPGGFLYSKAKRKDTLNLLKINRGNINKTKRESGVSNPTITRWVEQEKDGIVTDNWFSSLIPSWSERPRKDREETEFRLNAVASKEITNIAPEKVVPISFIRDLTKDQLELFIEVSMLADGHSSRYISQKNSKFLDALEFACILSGRRTSRSTSYDKSKNDYKMYNLGFSKTKTLGFSHKETRPKNLKYSGIVWCPTTENGTWMARTKGHAYFTGNSDPTKLPVCFNGRITDVPVSEGELSVIALGDGVELVNQLDSNAVSYGKEVWSDTPGIFGKGGEPRDIILSFFTEPKGKFLNAVSRGAFGSENAYGIQNFGYYHQAFPWHDGGEMGINVYNSGDHREYLNKSSPLWNWFDVLNLKGWNTGQAILGIQMEDANPWKAIEVCRSVVPDYETAVVPFEFRSTLFYGATWYPLFYKYRPEAINQDGTLKNPSFITDGPGTLTDRSLTNMEDYFEIWEHKPFQQIHVYSSIANIIDNQIRADESRVRNECIGVGIYNGWLTMDRNEKSLKMQADWNIFPELKKLELYNTGIYSTTLQKLNDANSQRIGEARNTDINRGSALEQRFGIPLLENIADWVTSRLSSIINPVFSRKILDFAATTRLVDRLRDMYQGNLIVYGDPSVKPRDLCYLGDSYNSMDGVFEVKAVTHFLSLDTGFITTIEPDCCVAAADTWRYETWTAAQMIGARFIAGEASRYIYAKLAAGLHPLKVARAISQWLKNSGSAGKEAALRLAKNLEAGEKSGVYYEKVNGVYNSLTEFTGSTIEKIPGSEKGIGALKSVYEFLKGGSTSIQTTKEEALLGWERIQKLYRVYPAGTNPLTDLLESEQAQRSLTFFEFLNNSKAAKLAGSELSTLESLGALGSDLFVLGSRVARFGAMLFVIPAATELVTRYLASIHSCVIMPLRLGGKEFSAGITGHLGLVRGDPVSSADNAILGYTNASYADRYGTATQSAISRIFNILGVQTTDFHGEIQPETDPALLSKWKEEMIGKAAAIKGGDSYSTADQTFSNTGLSSTSASQPIVNSKVAWPLYNSKGKPIGTNPGDRSVHIPNTGFEAIRTGKNGAHLHAGWDFSAPPGTPIYSIAMGTVIYSSPDSRGALGYHTIVDHGGWYSGYHHMQSPGPPKGTIVTPGVTILGGIGRTGNVHGPTGYHLHLAIFDNNYFYDPVPILQNGKFDPTIADRSPLWGSYKEIIKNK